MTSFYIPTLSMVTMKMMKLMRMMENNLCKRTRFGQRWLLLAKPKIAHDLLGYLPERNAKVGVIQGRFFQGTSDISTYSVTEAKVTTALKGKDPSKRTKVLIVGRENQNCAIDGDVFIIELPPTKEWQLPYNLVVDEEDVDVHSEEEDSESIEANK